MSAAFVIGTDVAVMMNGVPVINGKVSHSIGDEVVSYKSFDGVLLGFTQPDYTITIETPEQAANPLDAAIAAQRLAKVPQFFTMTDLTTGKVATGWVGVSLTGKDRSPGTPGTRSYKLIMAGNELEI